MAEERKRLAIGLMGIGHIGSGIWEILRINGERIAYESGREIYIKRILVRDVNKPREIEFDRSLLTDSFEELVNDPEIEIMVELVGGIEGAYTYIKEALLHGKHVVTANKAVIAERGGELFRIAESKGVALRIEGSVAGGIPIISVMEKSLTANRVESIMGIVNGTTNYILTKMSDANHLSFDAALQLAMRRGYAEPDPSSDLEGTDAAYKLSILALMAFGAEVKPSDIPCTGIGSITQTEISYADKSDCTVKLLADARRSETGSIELSVGPALVPNSHPMASVKGANNALFIHGNAVGDLMLYGKGAGMLPTASAVMADIISVARGELGFIKLGDSGVELSDPGVSGYYIRLQVEDKPGVLGEISTLLGGYRISIASVLQEASNACYECGEEVKDEVSLIFVTHAVEYKQLESALSALRGFTSVRDVACVLRVLERREH